MDRHSLSTSSSKKIILFIGKLFLLLFIVIFLCLYAMPQYLGEYNASLIDKMERLESTDGPKIVLLGNSNVTFGMKSELLEKAFGMPVVNMGLTSLVGNAFHEEMAKTNVSAGDIYILCHSDYGEDSALTSSVSVWVTIEDHFKLWRLLRPENVWPMYKEFPNYFKNCLECFIDRNGNARIDGPYSRDAFNQYGDESFPRPMAFEGVTRSEQDFSISGSDLIPDFSMDTAKRINELDDYLTSKGAILLVAGYPIYGKYDSTEIRLGFRAFQNELEKNLKCPVISDFTDYMFDHKYFYNTILHLNDEGAVLRTEQLISDIKRWMSENERVG